METKFLENKLKKLIKQFEYIVSNKSLNIKDIHTLRVQTRDILSCITHNNLFYKKLKKVIKLTNEIRDIDVFQNEFLEKLPLKLKQHIDFDLIAIHLKNIRDLDCIKLCEYITTIEAPQTLTPRKMVDTNLSDKIEKVELKKFSQKELHKYRLYIKKELYYNRAFHPQKKKKIKTLTKIKDHLGIINDNYNAKKRITTFLSVNEKELLSYIKKENQKYLDKVLKLKTTLEI